MSTIKESRAADEDMSSIGNKIHYPFRQNPNNRRNDVRPTYVFFHPL